MLKKISSNFIVSFNTKHDEVKNVVHNLHEGIIYKCINRNR